ncbi:hypothetical protein PoB_006745400 [Plakobranchus ocellatus]|uniref:SMB domain-containing protein n=1 Tax=Plakobranchus ocellatus TaxID=259542 RepID=A0AAV4D9Y7_9GAST|nr:hypothetical protein PoB_006745400 [Plakobranchus ocellatus]
MILSNSPTLLSSRHVFPLSNSTTTSILSTFLYQAYSENYTSSQSIQLLFEGPILSRCQENRRTFNASLNKSHPEKRPEKGASSLCALQSLSNSSQYKISNNTSEQFEEDTNKASATKPITILSSSLAKPRPPGMFREWDVPFDLEKSIDNIVTGNTFNATETSLSNQKDYLDARTFSFGQVTQPSLMGDENELSLPLTFTCKDLCGKEISFPCSCSPTCVVYDTCCDSMAQDCPHVWNEGLTRFDHIRTANFVCDENSIYTIVSCPKTNKENIEQNKNKTRFRDKQISRDEIEGPKTQLWIFSNVDTTTQRKQVIRDNSAGAMESQSPKESTISKILAAISAAPVTDSITGFTFINKTVYNCYGMPESNALQWAVWLNYTYASPTSLEDFVKHQIISKYQPDFNKDILKAHLCNRNIKHTCKQNADHKESFEAYAEKCNQSNNAVLLSRLPPFVYYRNRFCAYCNEGRHNKYALYVLNSPMLLSSGLRFHLLMSLTGPNKFSLKLNKLAGDGTRNVKIPWSLATCSVQDPDPLKNDLNAVKSEQENRSLCSATCDDPSFTLRLDGICKAPHEALMAIADDGLVPMCPAAMAGLAEFVVCGLKKEIESLKNADFKTPSVSVVFDSSLNTSLYVVHLYMALPVPSKHIFSKAPQDISQNIYSVALLAKSFHHYRNSHPICPQGEKERNTESKTIASSSLFQYGRMWSHNLTKSMEKLRGPRLHNQNKTTVCLTPTNGKDKMDPKRLLCMIDPVHEFDSSLISRFRNSSCFNYFDNLEKKIRNRATTFIENYEMLIKCEITLGIFVAVMLLFFD